MAIPHYWMTGLLYATAGLLVIAAVLLWGVGVRNFLASRRG